MDFYPPPDTFDDIDPSCINRISAIHDGINLHFLDNAPLNVQAELVNFISYTADVIFGLFQLGAQQHNSLLKAILYAIENLSCYTSEMDAISDGLETQGSSVAGSVSSRLWHILHCNILRNNGKK